MSVTCNPRGPITAPKQPEIRLKQVFLCQISGHYKELRAKYPHPRPYPGLALPGSRGPNLSSCYARGRHQNPKTTRDTSKITVFRCVYAVLQMGRSVCPSVDPSIGPLERTLFFFCFHKNGENSEQVPQAGHRCIRPLR